LIIVTRRARGDCFSIEAPGEILNRSPVSEEDAIPLAFQKRSDLYRVDSTFQPGYFLPVRRPGQAGRESGGTTPKDASGRSAADIPDEES
jgi:hypothetical protein